MTVGPWTALVTLAVFVPIAVFIREAFRLVGRWLDQRHERKLATMVQTEQLVAAAEAESETDMPVDSAPESEVVVDDDG